MAIPYSKQKSKGNEIKGKKSLVAIRMRIHLMMLRCVIDFTAVQFVSVSLFVSQRQDEGMRRILILS